MRTCYVWLGEMGKVGFPFEKESSRENCSKKYKRITVLQLLRKLKKFENVCLFAKPTTTYMMFLHRSYMSANKTYIRRFQCLKKLFLF